MARTARQTPTADTTPMDTPEAHTAMTELHNAAAGQVATVAALTGHALAPYSRENALIRLRGYMVTATEAMLNIGLELIHIRENESPDDYARLIERAGMERRIAQRCMQAARKFHTALPADKRGAFESLGKSKMLELLVLDDEDIEALADGEAVAGVTLDEVDTMSTSELRAALRESKRKAEADASTAGRLLDGKNQQIDKLTEQLDRATNGAPDDKARAAAEREAAAVRTVADATLALLGQVQQFDQALGALLACASQSSRTHAEQTCAFAFERIAEIATERQMPVDFAAIVAPEWAAGMTEAELAEAIAQAA